MDSLQVSRYISSPGESVIAYITLVGVGGGAVTIFVYPHKGNRFESGWALVALRNKEIKKKIEKRTWHF